MSTDNRDTDRRIAERRSEEDPGNGPCDDVARAIAGERRAVDQRGIVASMTDALEDILKWERASERVMRVAENNTDAS